MTCSLWQRHSADRQRFSCLWQHPWGTHHSWIHDSSTGASTRKEAAAWEWGLNGELGIPPCKGLCRRQQVPAGATSSSSCGLILPTPGSWKHCEAGHTSRSPRPLCICPFSGPHHMLGRSCILWSVPTHLVTNT